MTTLRTAAVQLNTGADIQDNVEVTSALIREAAGQGVEFIVTPENTCQMVFPFRERFKHAGSREEHPAVKAYAALAAELGVHLLIGSLQIKLSEEKLANRSFLFAPDGCIAATYDKIHLFDVDLENGESYRESEVIAPGDQAVTAEIGSAKIGLSICYDIRFPHLYRDLAKAGAQILTVPAAFTVPTGKAHWEVLLRARAIETGCYVMAAAQTGHHPGGRETYGHSMIVNPWGEVVAELGSEPGILVADIDLDATDNARGAIPALQHDRDYSL